MSSCNGGLKLVIKSSDFPCPFLESKKSGIDVILIYCQIIFGGRKCEMHLFNFSFFKMFAIS